MRSEGDGFGDVGSALDAAVEDDFGVAVNGLGDFGEHFHGALAVV